MLQFIDKSKGYSSREEWSDNGNGNAEKNATPLQGNIGNTSRSCIKREN